jgi:putative transposase
VVRGFDGRAARALRAEFPYLRRFADMLWSPSYVGSSVGNVSKSTLRSSVEHHWDAVAS